MNRDIFLGVDIGYGFTRTFNSGGGKMFPTAVTTMILRSTFREIETITANGEKFLVADNALPEGKWVLDTRNTGFIRSNGWLAVLGHSLSINDYNPDEMSAGVLVLGMPPGLYSRGAASEIMEFIKTKTPKCEQYYTTRSELDEKRAINEIAAVWNGISKSVFIPNDGASNWKCKHCHYAKACSTWFLEVTK